MKMYIYKVFFILCYLGAFSTKLFSNNFENIEYILPIVKYNPYNFEEIVKNSVVNPRSGDYIRIAENYNDTCFYHDKWGDKILIFEDKKEKRFRIKLGYSELVAYEKVYPIEGIKDKLENTDSLFVLFFKDNLYSRYKGRLPIKYFGAVNNGKLIFFKNEAANEEKYSLREIVELEFGSVDKLKQELTQNLIEGIYFNIDNGIYSLEKDSMIHFLQRDFVFYESIFPANEENILDLFFRFISEHVLISEIQKKQIEEQIKKNKNKQEFKNEIFQEDYFNYKINIKVLGKDITPFLLKSLTREQYLEIINRYQIKEYVRQKYYEKLYFILDSSNNPPENISAYIKDLVFGKSQ